MGDRDHKTALFDQFARVGKALASGKRLELLDLLAQGERDVASLAAAADLGVTTASAHLQTLRQANLVTTRRDGTRILYRLAGRTWRTCSRGCARSPSRICPMSKPPASRYLGADGGEPVTRDATAAAWPRPPASPCWTCARPRSTRPGTFPGRGQHSPRRVWPTGSPSCPTTGRSWPTAAAPTACSPTTPSGCCAPTAATPLRLADGMLEWRLAGLPVAT